MTCYVYYAERYNISNRNMRSLKSYEDKDLAKIIKIGETMNRGRRNSQLRSTDSDMTITDFISFDGEDADRKFVESYIRLKIAQSGRGEQVGNDHFRCYSVYDIRFIKKNFLKWANEALEIINNID